MSIRRRLEEMVEGLIGLGEGDAYGLRSETTNARFKSGALVEVRHHARAGAGLRVVRDGRLGSAGGTLHASTGQLVQDASDLARFGPEVGDLALPRTPPPSAPRAPEGDLEADALIERGREIVALLQDARDDISVDARVSWTRGRGTLLNTSGLSCEAESARYQIYAVAHRNRDHDLISASASADVPRVDLPRAAAAPLARQILERLARCDRAATLKTGDYPVVFTGWGVYGLLYPILAGLDGMNLARGSSPLADDPERLRPVDGLDLFSDPTLADAPASGAWDGDGLPAERAALLRGGRLERGLFDLFSAALWSSRVPGERPAWVRPGAAQRADYSGSTAPSYATLTLTPGDTPDLFAGIERGLWVEQLLGVRMGNPLSGEFSNNVYVGHLIEDGQVVGRVKDLMISGDAYQALGTLEAIGDAPEWIGSNIYAPGIRLGRLRVTSKG